MLLFLVQANGNRKISDSSEARAARLANVISPIFIISPSLL